MTKIYVIRHAEAEGNLYRIAQGQYDSILTDWGHRQIEALTQRFADIPIDAVYSSDLYRTCATATAIYKPKGLPLHRRADLREICVGEWEQKTWGQIARETPELLENFSTKLHLWNVPGAETLAEVQARVLGAVQEIARENEGKTVAVFSHGCAIRLLLAAVQGVGADALDQTPPGDNTAVSLLEAEGDRLRAVFRDDNTHLNTLETFARRPNGLEPGLYFEPLRLPEQAAFLASCLPAGGGLPEVSVSRPVLVGYLKDEPVSVIQFCPEREAAEGCGWISLYCMAEGFRGRGFGVQMLGQAVWYYRPLGRDRLRLVLPEQDVAAQRFFSQYGFHPVGDTIGGDEVWEKNIGFQPEFLY